MSDQLRLWFRVCTCALGFVLFAAPVYAGEGFRAGWVPAVRDHGIPVNSIPPSEPEFHMMASPGEYEPASFVVFSADGIEELEVVATELTNAEGSPLDGASIDIRVVKRWYQRSYGALADKNLRYLTSELLLYDDELIRTESNENYLRLTDGQYKHVSQSLNVSRREATSVTELPVRDAVTLQPVSVKAGQNKQFWVTVHTPEDAAPGVYAAAIELEDKAGDSVSLRLMLELLPIELGEADIDISIYYRAQLDSKMPEGSVSSEVKSEAQYLAELRNLAAHGVRHPVIYQKYETGKFGRVLELWDEAGLLPTPRLIYHGAHIVPNSKSIIPQSLLDRVRDVINQASRHGVEQVYFYAQDERRGEELRYQFPFWDAVRGEGGKIIAAGWQSDASQDGNFDISGGKEDLFASLGTARRSESARWHSKGRLIYSYQNPTGGYELPETYRRNYGLLLWQKNYDGAIPYAYQDSFKPWHEFGGAKLRELSFTYPTLDGPIDTIQWEGFREGVDDLRYLAVLKNLIDTNSGKPVEAAAQWLAKLKDSVLARQDLDRVRQGFVGHILAIQGLAAGDPELLSSSVQTGAVHASGHVTVRWSTSNRSGGRVWLHDARSGWTPAADSEMRVREHAVQLSGLSPDKDYRFRITRLEADDAEEPLYEGRFRTAPVIQAVAMDSSINAGVADINVRLASDYESSVVIDWERSLLGWWRFSEVNDGVVTDLSGGSRRPAELKGGAQLGEGRYGQGVTLDGNSAFVSIPDIQIPENGAATIEGWFRFDTFAMDERENIGLFSGLYQHASNNNIYLARTNEYFMTSNRLQKGVWHHIAWTWDGDASSAVLYVDGYPLPAIVLGDVDDIREVKGLVVGRNRGYLGGLVRAVKGNMAGHIDEVRVWNRPLSEEEVKASWAAGRNPDLSFRYTVTGDGAEFRVLGANGADQTLKSDVVQLPR